MAKPLFQRRCLFSRWKSLLSWHLALVPAIGLALDPAKSVFQYNCLNWTHQDSLPVNRVSAITQPRDGYLWLGTQKGLVRFDGARFVLVTLPTRPEFPSQSVSCLSSGREGEVWFGVTVGSFGFHDGHSFGATDAYGWSQFGKNVLTIRQTSDNAIWAGLETGLLRVVPGNTNATSFFETIPNCTSIYEDHSGRVWLGTAHLGLYCWRKEKLTSFPDDNLKKAIVFAIAEDSQGNLWLGTEYGPRCYNANFQSNSIPELYNEVRALLVDRHGTLWMGTRGNGLARFQNGILTFLRKADGLASDSITSLYEDYEGSLWVGTTEGLSQLSDVKFPTFSATEGLLAGSCHGVAPSANGGVWVTLDRGISWFDGKSATNFSTEIGLVTPYIKRAYEASNGDIYLLDGAKNIEVLSGDKITARFANDTWPGGMVEDSKGMIVSIGGDLFRVDTNGLAPFAYKNSDSPPFYWIYNVCLARDGGIWVASVNGLFHVRNGIFKHWGTDEGLSTAKVNWVSEDAGGIVWAGLITGIARIKNGQVNCFSREDGLFDNNIYAIVPDDFGSLWVQSSRGIFRVRRQVLEDFAQGKIGKIDCTGYDGLEALKTIDTAEIEASGCKTRDGRIWFPNPAGVVIIDPAHIYTNKSAPPVRLERIRVDGTDVTGKTSLNLRPGPGELEVEYTALSFIAPQNVRFRYRLQGFDRDWVDAGNRRSALYANLKPSKYRFHVQACNSDGIWNTEGSRFEFELPPHFYETAWFKVACAFGAVCTLFAMYRWLLGHLHSKQRKLQAANELLESKVRERTARLETLHKQLVDASREAGKAEVATNVLHNVGNVLNSVNVSTDLLKERIADSRLSNLNKVTALLREHQDDLPQFLTEDDKGRQLVPYLETLSEYSAAEQGEFLAELDSLARNIEHIKTIVATQQSYARVSDIADLVDLASVVEDALSMHAAAYQRHSVKVIRQFEKVPLMAVDRHRVLQILVNLFHNAKYACESARASEREVIVRIATCGSERVQVQVLDNGIGIAPENLTRIFSHGFTTRKNGHGFGLHSGAIAAQEMSGSLKAESDGIGKGATFTLELPLRPTIAHPSRNEAIAEPESPVVAVLRISKHP
jgi:ligand-binding sensor domain-containing protein/signal transduction histidine kinase